MLRDYYKILEVPREANAEAIKRAYRKLVLAYHPDRNDDPDAHRVFFLIHEAYQILGNPEKRVNYNYLYDLHFLQQLQQELNSVEKNKAAQLPRRRPAYKSSQPDNYSYYARYARYISVFTLFFCIALILDYLSVRTYPNEVVHQMKTEKLMVGSATANPVLTVRTPQCEFLLDSEKYNYIAPGDTVNASITPIFNIATKVELQRKGDSRTFSPHYNVYNLFSFVFIALLLTSVAGSLFTSRYPEFVFNAGIANGALFPLVLYFLLIS